MNRPLPWTTEGAYTSRDKPGQPDGDSDYAALISQSSDETWTWTVWSHDDAQAADGSAPTLAEAQAAADMVLERLYPGIVVEPVPPLRVERVYWLGGSADEAVYPPPCPEAEQLRALRHVRGITLGAAARALGLSVSEVSGLERGRRRPGEETTWADVLELVRGSA